MKIVITMLYSRFQNTRLLKEITFNRRRFSKKSEGVYSIKNFTFLLFTNTLTLGGCMFMGDLVEQELEYRSNKLTKRYDWIRAGNMFTVGALMGPLYHCYYLALEKIMPHVSVKLTVVKIIMDQIIISPINLLGFFCGMNYLEGKSFQTCAGELEKKFVTTFAVDCLYWAPVQFVNFFFLPVTYRVLYVSFATMIYNIFLSYMKHYDEHP